MSTEEEKMKNDMLNGFLHSALNTAMAPYTTFMAPFHMWQGLMQSHERMWNEWNNVWMRCVEQWQKAATVVFLQNADVSLRKKSKP